jgi:hypothetical protein
MTPDKPEWITDDPLSLEYIVEAQMLAADISSGTATSQQSRDIVDYVTTMVYELDRLRSKVAYLEGWKQGMEGAKIKPKVYRSSPADETRQAAEDRLNRA